MTIAISLFAFVISVLVVAYGILSVVDPEMAFRIENFLQLRDVELSDFGIMMHVVGGVFLLFATPFIVGQVLGPLQILGVYVVAGAPFVRWYDLGPDWLFRRVQ